MAKNKKPLRAKLIANPGSGNALENHARLELAVHCLTEHGIEVEVAFAAPKEEGLNIARRAVKDGFKIIIAMGGDGTIGEVIRGIAGSKATLGLLVGGTMNDIAASLGIPEDIKEACALIASGQTRKLDLGQIKTDDYKKFYFFMVTVIGLTATLFPEVKKIPKGNFSTLKDAVVTFLDFNPKPDVFLTLDDDSKIKVQTMLVTVANTPLIASKNLVAPDASLEDGLFDISVFPDFSKAEVLGYFARTSNEGLIADGKLQRFRARKIKIKTSPELDIAADGILLGKGKAVIKMCPGALRVFAPPVDAGAEKQPEEKVEELPAPLSPYVETEDESSPEIGV
ncbi:MAG: diacylglycerol kinase family lipid kinase [Firmicutes bacterium]|nr:diacylglycerol kinase family lipid kinase [Bacillota bacterium]